MSIDLEYAIKQDVRNNPVVREVDLAQKREFVRMLGWAGLVVLMVMFALWPRTTLLSSGYNLEEMEFSGDSPSQERMVSAQQELVLVRMALAALSPKCRKVFMLSRAHHKTYPEIAQLCEISVKMVEKYMSQALGALRRAVGDRA